ncbi:MAG: hypothetical protein K9N46_03015 [Candidatus Marinimicrobia bacterium]|nr:hypothetical protein [Candidatus Neomarinimicrobiota bacterium]MCF7828132.1 hypothetical protein [Candidatus Neomarinimicrobiota bacterium]MCF7879693.1 hypothetical protein [Candidatus Neomarinimicrobiota bacterium]
MKRFPPPQQFVIIANFSLILTICTSNMMAQNLSIVRAMSSKDVNNYELLGVEIVENLMIVPGGLGGSVQFDISDPVSPVLHSAMRKATLLR